MLSFPSVRNRLNTIYYGWRVVAACSFLAIFAGSIFSSGFSVFFLPLQQELHLSRTGVSMMFALGRGQAGLGGPLVGWLVDRWDPRPLVVVGGLMAGVGLIILSGLHSYWAILLVYVGLITVGNSAGFGQTFLGVVNRWFTRSRGVAMTLVTTAYAIGGAALVPLLSQGVLTLGWRRVALYAGIFVSVVVIPGAFYIRRSPESMGIALEETGRRNPGPSGRNVANTKTQDYTVREALRTPVYWFLLSASALRIAVTGAIMVHIIPIMVWKGASPQTGANLAALFFLLSIPLRLIMGLSSTRYPTQLLLAGGMLTGAVGVMALTFLSGVWVLYFFALSLAILEGASTLNWLIVGNFFGRTDFATLVGIISIFYSGGQLVSPIYLGWVFDRTQSYTIALVPLGALYVVSAILFAISQPPQVFQETTQATQGRRQ